MQFGRTGQALEQQQLWTAETMFVTWPPLGSWECLGPSDDYESRGINGIPSRESPAVVASSDVLDPGRTARVVCYRGEQRVGTLTVLLYEGEGQTVKDRRAARSPKEQTRLKCRATK